jgi:hypothetical protein
MPSPTLTLACAVLLQTALAIQLQSNVGRLPALGWNSWNAYRCNITEAKFVSAARMMINLGLKVRQPASNENILTSGAGCWIRIR